MQTKADRGHKLAVGRRRNTTIPIRPQFSCQGFLPASDASVDRGSGGGGGGKGPEEVAPSTGPTRLPTATSDPEGNVPEATTGSMAMSPSPFF